MATASVAGYRGNIWLQAAVGDNGSVQLSVIKHTETTGIGDLAVEKTVAQINRAQSLSVDVISGATVSSLATIHCAEAALTKLHVDIDRLRANPVLFPDIQTHYNCDVAVVGAGGAGLTAAIEAAQAGARVIVLEKLGVAGGSTARSDGKIMAVGTAKQQEQFADDRVSLFATDLFQYSDAELDLHRHVAMAVRSAENIAFLQHLGIPFSDNLSADANGNANRILQTAAETETGGGNMLQPLLDCAADLGVTILYNTEAYELLLDEYGTVAGVLSKNAAGTLVTVQSNAVVIASGGFDRSEQLLSQYGLQIGVSMSGLGSDGSGLTLARRAGAALYESAALMATLEDLDTGIFQTTGLIVDPAGQRIGNEAADPFALSNTLLARGYCYAYLITDATAYGEAIRKGLDTDLVVTAQSVAALADALKMDTLESTVESYNNACVKKADLAYGKSVRFLGAVDQAPYCAVRLTLRSYGTLGGLITSEDCEVLDANGKAIAGLFGAGEAINGAYYLKGFPGFGASLTEVIETGRVAGTAAAAFAKNR